MKSGGVERRLRYKVHAFSRQIYCHARHPSETRAAARPHNVNPSRSAGTHGLNPIHLPSSAPRRSSRKTTHNLVALGSAAVLAVYAAGYVRTRSAAQRFEGDGGGRRQPLAPKAIAGTPLAAPLVGPSAPAVVPAAPAVSIESIAAASPTPAPVVAPTTTPGATATEFTSAPAVAIDPWIPNATRLPVPAYTPPPPVAAISPPAPAQVAEASASAAPAAASEWKDGKYSGWGSSRHGDIQALVEIREGRIVSAIISSCRTVYSCDVISKVVPQVVTRQSADVDSVSGATQSADAYFWAVSSALTDAKAAMKETKASVPAAK